MTVPATALDVMSVSQFRWELRLQPTKPEDSILEGIIKRAIAWCQLNTGLQILPYYHVVELGPAVRAEGYVTGFSSDQRQIRFVAQDVIQLHTVNYGTHAFDDTDLLGRAFHNSDVITIERSTQTPFPLVDSTVRVTIGFWRGLHLEDPRMEDIRSLIAAIGRELFDGLAFRHQIRATLAMVSIVDRLAQGTVKFGGVLDTVLVTQPAIPANLLPPASADNGDMQEGT